MKQHTKDSLIAAIEEDEQWHFRRLRLLSIVQWVTTIVVAAAGGLTTFAGTPAASGTIMSYPQSLLAVGIITAVGAAINQGVNFNNRIARHRAAGLGHRLIKEGLGHGLSVERASKLRASVFSEPEVALKVLSGGV